MSKPEKNLQEAASDDLAEFEKQLEATLALDPVERLNKLTLLTEDLRGELDSGTRTF